MFLCLRYILFIFYKVLDLYYSPFTSAVERELNGKWLQNFLMQPIAWEIILELSNILKYQIYYTSLLSRKIMLTWKSLKSEDQKKMTDLILERIQENISQPVFSSGLCLCLTYIIIHSTPKNWPDPIQDTIFLSHSSNLLWVQFVKILAEEVSKCPSFIIESDYEILRSYCSKSSSEKIVYRLCYLIRNEKSVNLKLESMNALEQWVGYLPFSIDLVHQVIEIIIQLILETPENSCSICSEIFYELISLPSMKNHPQSILFILDNLMILEALTENAIQNNLSEIVSALVSIFTSVGIEHSDIVIKSETGLKLMNLVAKCIQLKSVISSECYDFWKEMQDSIIKNQDEQLEDMYKPYFQNIIFILLDHSRYDPIDESYFEFRFQCADQFLELYRFIPAEELAIFYQTLNSSCDNYLTNPSKDLEIWIEVSLWAWASITEDLLEEEEWTYKLLQVINKLPNQNLFIQKSIVNLIEKLSPWISCHQQTIPFILGIVIKSLKSKEIAPYATSAFKAIFDHCAHLINSFLDEILIQVLDLLPNLPYKSRSIIISSLAYQVSFLEPNQGSILLVKLAGNLPQQMIEISKNSNLFSIEEKKTLIEGIENLNSLFVSPSDLSETFDLSSRKILSLPKVFIPPDKIFSYQKQWSKDVLLPLLDLTWPVIEQIVHCENFDEEFSIPILDYFKKSLMAIKRFVFCSYLPKILQTLVFIFQKIQISSVFLIYDFFVSIYKTVYSKEDIQRLTQPEYHEIVELGLLNKDFLIQENFIIYHFFICFKLISETTLNILIINSQPDISHIDILRFYYLKCINSTLENMPQLFFADLEITNSIFKFSIEILPIINQNKDVRMFTKIIQAFYKINHPNEQHGFNSIKQNLFDLLIKKILVSIGGESPRSCLPSFSNILFWLLKYYPQKSQITLSSLFSQHGFPSPNISNENKNYFLEQIFKDSKSQNRIISIVNDFSVICRGIQEPFNYSKLSTFA